MRAFCVADTVTVVSAERFLLLIRSFPHVALTRRPHRDPLPLARLTPGPYCLTVFVVYNYERLSCPRRQLLALCLLISPS